MKHLSDVEMNASRRSQEASSSLRAGASTVSDPPPTACQQLGKEPAKRSQEPGGVITYRGIRGLKHRNDRLHRSVTTTAMVLGRPPAQAVTERLPPRQNGVDQCLSSADQPRPVQPPSSRRSASADRQISSTSTPRTLFERLYYDKVHVRAMITVLQVVTEISSVRYLSTKSCLCDNYSQSNGLLNRLSTK